MEELKVVMDAAWWEQGHEMALRLGSAFYRTLETGVALPSPDHAAGPNRPWPWAMFLELTLAQLVLNFGVRTVLVQPLARLLMLFNAQRKRKVTHSRVVKFAQSTMETLFYSCYFAMGLRVVGPQSWTWPSTNWWLHQPDNRFIADDVTFFYIAYCARYFQGFIMVFLEPKRKDFLEMQIHHSVTCVLIFLSYTYGFVRVGCIIMVLLDIADPPLHLAKQFVYLKEVRGPQTGLLSWSNIADAFFAIFAVVFTVTRMMLYPYVVWSVYVELYKSKSPPNEPFNFFEYAERVGVETIMCIALVTVLQILQVFWWMLLCKAVIKVIAGSDLKDERSDSEHSDMEDSDKVKKAQ